MSTQLQLDDTQKQAVEAAVQATATAPQTPEVEKLSALTTETKEEQPQLPQAVVEPAHEVIYDKIRNGDQYLGKNFANGLGDAHSVEIERDGTKATSKIKLSPHQETIVEWKKDLNSWLDQPETQHWLKERGVSAEELRLETSINKGGTSVGVFDPETETTTLAFQQWFRETQPDAAGWASKVDAIVGPRTMRAMDTVLGRTDKLLDESTFNEAAVRSDYVKSSAKWDFLSKAYIKAKSAEYKELGDIAEHFESGGRGAGTISTGKGDHGGVSYGTYQLSSATGTLDAYLKTTVFKDQFEGLTPGSDAFERKWKELAKDPEFGNDQRAFIIASHYDVQVNKLQEAGINLSNHGAAVQEAIFSTSTQYGPHTSVIVNALSGVDVSKLSDLDVVRRIQGYKADNVYRNFKSSSRNVQESVKTRIRDELAALEEVAQRTRVG